MRWQQLRPSCLKRSLYKLAYDGKKKSRANKRSGMIFNRRLASDSQHKLKNNAGGESGVSSPALFLATVL
jgi:hypothetical protein